MSTTSSKIDIDTFNDYMYENLQSDVPYYNEIVNQLTKKKGKQLRPRLALLCASLGGELNERSYRAAMIVEMLHTASLVHDDIVDDSVERRGVPSVNVGWSNRIALFSGDIISLKALLLSLSNKDYDIFEIYGNAVDQIVQGELIQLKKTRNLNTSEDIYFDIIKAKTAAFFSAACESGACSTMADAEKVKKLSLFGEYLGIAFQIRDDLFGYSDVNVGKPVDNDFQEKKLTLPIIYLINNVGRRHRWKIKRMIKHGNVGKKQIDYLIQEVKAIGGIDYARSVMNDYGQKALKILQEFPESDVRDELEGLVKYTIDRKY